MSVKVMAKVWELDLPANKLLVLLAMADHADHDGNNVFPSIDLVSWKTGYSEVQTRRIIHALTKDNLLKVEKKSNGRYPNLYSIHTENGKQKPARGIQPSQNDRVQPYQNGTVKVAQPSQNERVNPITAMIPESSIESSIKELTTPLPPKKEKVAPKPRPRDAIFDVIALYSFGLKEVIIGGKFIGTVSAAIKKIDPPVTEQELIKFYEWYKIETNGITPPRYPEKLINWFQKFRQTGGALPKNPMAIHHPINDDAFSIPKPAPAEQTEENLVDLDLSEMIKHVTHQPEQDPLRRRL